MHYTVKRVSEMSGVSVRALHHYDEIGLLTPSMRSEAGYRLYDESDLLRLQHILLLKTLDMPLREIRAVIDRPDFDVVQSLRRHRMLLEQKVGALHRVLQTLDNTISRMEATMKSPGEEELFAGFDPKTIEEWNSEVENRYDPELVAESRRRVKNMTKEDAEVFKEESEALNRAWVAVSHLRPDDDDVQRVARRHHAWIENFYVASPDVLRGLGELYTTDSRFRAYYEAYAPGLAEFVRASLDVYAARIDAGWDSEER
ncbi:MAG TPA: MerR family transcriptional regulator [Chlorobiota bacterium]|nr:MerR family transcriptional regulator [Chlorobiota bacterium]